MPTSTVEAVVSAGASPAPAAALAEGAPVSVDIAVIGAGPAGLAAATTAARRGARVALLDAAPRPGGQYWRHRDGDDGRDLHDGAEFRRLRADLDAAVAHGALAYLADHPCWHLERTASGFVAHVVHAGAEREVRASAVIVATGAYDRQLPFPGWTLPGVFTAGGVQALLKGQGVVAGRRIVVAGTGPFLLPVAAGLAAAGADVATVLEAGRPTAAMRRPAVAALNAGKLAEGARYLATLARHRVPYRMRRAVVAAYGDGAMTAVAAVTTAALDADWRIVPGSEERIACDTVAVGYGFTPQVELAVGLGCAMTVDADGSLVAVADAEQRSSVDGAWVAGEVCGVGGAALALVEGRIAGLHAAAAVTGRPVAPDALRPLHRRRARLRAFADLLPRAFPVRPGWRTWLAEDTLVCRCEEVPASAVRASVTALGATDARAAKLFARSGMGLCQGRVCGYATAALVAEACGRDVAADDLHAIARRPTAWPITLGVLAAGDGTDRGPAGPGDPRHPGGSAATDPTAIHPPTTEEAPA
jgi:NADPH-dependent 2,4-dienoyl-CoA reductase/sulfur reductase-like enzyme